MTHHISKWLSTLPARANCCACTLEAPLGAFSAHAGFKVLFRRLLCRHIITGNNTALHAVTIVLISLHTLVEFLILWLFFIECERQYANIFSLMVRGCVKLLIVKKLCLHFRNQCEKWWSWTDEMHTNWHKQVLSSSVFTYGQCGVNVSVNIYKCVWAPDRPLHFSCFCFLSEGKAKDLWQHLLILYMD